MNFLVFTLVLAVGFLIREVKDLRRRLDALPPAKGFGDPHP